MRYIVNTDLDISTGLDPESDFGHCVKLRESVVANEDSIGSDDLLRLYSSKDNLIYTRSPEKYRKDWFKKITPDTWNWVVYVPSTKSHPMENKYGSNMVFPHGCIFAQYLYNLTEEDSRYRSRIKELFLFYKLAIVNTLKLYVDESQVELTTHEVLLNKKKICGGEDWHTQNFAYSNFVITLDFNETKDVFAKYLTKDELLRTKSKTDTGISGVLNEISGLTREVFINDLVDQSKLLLEKILKIKED